jgi:HAD superfamily phosphatase
MTPYPSVIIFDVDGVLVDVRGSFHTTVVETVEFFTGKHVTEAELHAWKNRSGFNDDWVLSTAWVKSLGGNFEFDEVKRKFVELYWGTDGQGNVAREKWLLPVPNLKRLAARSELAIFTGRTYRELDFALARCNTREFFKTIITVEDVSRPKPSPEGLIKILSGRDPAAALYIGDIVDDALSSQAAGIPFVGVLPESESERKARSALLTKEGALAILSDIQDLELFLEKGAAAFPPRT